ncbi:MAG TPA: hypothetical protein VH593_30525 [Ktedonobacteraceae bacterium]
MQPKTSEEPQDQTTFTPEEHTVSRSQPPLAQDAKPAPSGNHSSLFYTQDDPGDQVDFQLPPIDEQDDQQSAPFVLPFQPSGPMPAVTPASAQASSMGTPPPAPPPAGRSRWDSFRLLKVLLIAGVVLITVTAATLLIFAQPTSSPKTTHSTPTKSSTPTPSPSGQGQGSQGNGNGPSSALPSAQRLSTFGWTQAGLSTGDALEAFRTATTFTDREMSLDYRNIGTPGNHSGTLTAATFLLTAGGQVRFVHHDVREINNVLYDTISSEHLIQQVVNPQPALIHFQVIPVQGQAWNVAWVNVSFELFQSKLDPTSGKRIEGLEPDAKTGQPMIHNMMVVLVWVSPQEQGVNAPMGGTGWLVNTYELDIASFPQVETSPSV